MSEPLQVMLSVASWGELMLLYSGRIQKGVFQIRSAKAVPPGTVVKVTLVMPDRQEVLLTGKVSTCPAEGDGFQVKLALDPLARLDKERLDNVTSGKPGSRTPVSGVPIVVAPRTTSRTPVLGTPAITGKPAPVAAPPRPQPSGFVRPAAPPPATSAPAAAGDSLLDIFDDGPRLASPSEATVKPGTGQQKRDSLAGIFDTVTPQGMPTPLMPGDAQLNGVLKRADEATLAKNWATAASAFEGALRLMPGDPNIEARFGLMRAREALAAGDEDTARIFVTGALERDPSVLPDKDELRRLLGDKKPPPPSKSSGLIGRLLGRK